MTDSTKNDLHEDAKATLNFIIDSNEVPSEVIRFTLNTDTLEEASFDEKNEADKIVLLALDRVRKEPFFSSGSFWKSSIKTVIQETNDFSKPQLISEVNKYEAHDDKEYSFITMSVVTPINSFVHWESPFDLADSLIHMTDVVVNINSNLDDLIETMNYLDNSSETQTALLHFLKEVNVMLNKAKGTPLFASSESDAKEV